MKKLILLFLLSAVCSFGQTVTYAPSAENIPNPERGFYHHTETKASAYHLLSASTLASYKADNVRLIMRVWYLDAFRSTSTISPSFITNLTADFAAIRASGMKVIVRFAYTDKNLAGQQNATKARILAHIQQLAPILNANADVIACIQAGFIGTWGEWYYTDYFGTGTLSATNLADRKEVMTAMLSSFPRDRQIQVRTPAIKQKMYGSIPVTQSQAFTLLDAARVGHHNDCFLASGSDYGTYANKDLEYPYLEAENKYLVMGGETCAPSTYSECVNALAMMNKFSYDYLNIDYNGTVIADFAAKNCLEEIKRRLGCRFELVGSTLSPSFLSITIRNTGFGHLYNPRSVFVIYRNAATGVEYPVKVNTECRLWLKGSDINLSQEIPALPAGSYKLFLSLPDPKLPQADYAIQFANVGTWEAATGYNDLNQTLIKN